MDQEKVPPPWHEFDDVRLETRPLQAIINDYGTKDDHTLVAAPDDTRIEQHLPTQNERLPTGTDALSFPGNEELFIDDLPTTDSSYPFEDDTFDVGYLLLEPREQFERIHPFFDLTRVVKSGGSIIAITGIKGNTGCHDASYWFPTSDNATPDTAHVLGYEDARTPTIPLSFTVHK